MRRFVGLLRLLAAAAALTALVGNFVYVLGFSTFTSVNYFSYFTQQSNTANAAVLVASGVTALRGRSESRLFAAVHALVTTYVIVSGVVYAIIVAESVSNDYPIGVPWSSQVLHFWIPTFVVVDWIAAPGRTRVSWKVLSVVLVFPIVWGIATIVRGAEVGWYPYFFLDPAQVLWPGEYLTYNAIALGTIVGVLVGADRAQPPASAGATPAPTARLLGAGVRRRGRSRRSSGSVDAPGSVGSPVGRGGRDEVEVGREARHDRGHRGGVVELEGGDRVVARPSARPRTGTPVAGMRLTKSR